MPDGTGIRGEVRGWTEAWWLLLLSGLLGVVAGVIVLAKPGISLATLAVVAGIFLLADGILEIAASLSRTTESRGFVALLGVLSVVAGVILVRHPIAGIVAVALLIGIWLITFGVVRLMAALTSDEHRVWNVVWSVVELMAGIVIVSSPDIGVATLALLVGIAFIVRGIATTTVAWAMHRVRRLVSTPTSRDTSAGARA